MTRTPIQTLIDLCAKWGFTLKLETSEIHGCKMVTISSEGKEFAYGESRTEEGDIINEAALDCLNDWNGVEA